MIIMNIFVRRSILLTEPFWSAQRLLKIDIKAKKLRKPKNATRKTVAHRAKSHPALHENIACYSGWIPPPPRRKRSEQMNKWSNFHSTFSWFARQEDKETWITDFALYKVRSHWTVCGTTPYKHWESATLSVKLSVINLVWDRAVWNTVDSGQREATPPFAEPLMPWLEQCKKLLPRKGSRAMIIIHHFCRAWVLQAPQRTVQNSTKNKRRKGHTIHLHLQCKQGFFFSGTVKDVIKLFP